MQTGSWAAVSEPSAQKKLDWDVIWGIELQIFQICDLWLPFEAA